MILTCPSCYAKYNVPEDSLGVSGRDVRCAKCGHMWHEKSSKDTLNDLINTIQSQEQDEILFNTHVDKPNLAGFSGKSKRLAGIKTFMGQMFRKKKTGDKALKVQVIFKSRTFAGFMVGLAIFMSVLYGLLAGRATLAHIMPSITRVYDNLGFYVDKPGAPNAETKLAFDRLKISDNMKIIDGLLVNLSSDVVRIPVLHIHVRDVHDTEIANRTYHLEQAQIEKEATLPIKIELNQAIPDTAASVHITFDQLK